MRRGGSRGTGIPKALSIFLILPPCVHLHAIPWIFHVTPPAVPALPFSSPGTAPHSPAPLMPPPLPQTGAAIRRAAADDEAARERAHVDEAAARLREARGAEAMMRARDEKVWMDHAQPHSRLKCAQRCGGCSFKCAPDPEFRLLAPWDVPPHTWLCAVA